MTEPVVTARAAITFAIALCDGKPRAEWIEKALELAGYRIVAADGAAAVVGAGGAKTVPQVPAKLQWPLVCHKCSRTRGLSPEESECERTDCPF
jgi:hypothetical protein